MFGQVVETVFDKPLNQVDLAQRLTPPTLNGLLSTPQIPVCRLAGDLSSRLTASAARWFPLMLISPSPGFLPSLSCSLSIRTTRSASSSREARAGPRDRRPCAATAAEAACRRPPSKGRRELLQAAPAAARPGSNDPQRHDVRLGQVRLNRQAQNAGDAALLVPAGQRDLVGVDRHARVAQRRRQRVRMVLRQIDRQPAVDFLGGDNCLPMSRLGQPALCSAATCCNIRSLPFSSTAGSISSASR